MKTALLILAFPLCYLIGLAMAFFLPKEEHSKLNDSLT